VSVFRVFNGTGQSVCPKNSFHQARCGTDQSLCLVPGLLMPHPSKAQTHSASMRGIIDRFDFFITSNQFLDVPVIMP
jgi:hypothetical protein